MMTVAHTEIYKAAIIALSQNFQKYGLRWKQKWENPLQFCLNNYDLQAILACFLTSRGVFAEKGNKSCKLDTPETQYIG